MNTHEKLMIAVIVLAVVHAVLSGLVLSMRDKVDSQKMTAFLGVSVVVCVTIAVLAYLCKNVQTA